jgi:hypothetical protein
MKLASSLSMNTTAFAISSGCPIRPSAVVARNASRVVLGVSVNGVAMTPLRQNQHVAIISFQLVLRSNCIDSNASRSNLFRCCLGKTDHTPLANNIRGTVRSSHLSPSTRCTDDRSGSLHILNFRAYAVLHSVQIRFHDHIPVIIFKRHQPKMPNRGFSCSSNSSHISGSCQRSYSA